MQAKLITRRGAAILEIKDKAAAAVRTFLDPLNGGPDKAGWPLGRAVGYGDLMRILVEIPGVLSVPDLHVRVGGKAVPPCQDASIAQYSLSEPAAPVIEVQEDGGQIA